MSKASNHVRKEFAKLVRKEGKKSSMKMGDALEFGGLLADRCFKGKSGAKLLNALVEWGMERREKRAMKKTRKAK